MTTHQEIPVPDTFTPDLELAILGGLLFNPTAIPTALATLTEDDFASEGHRLIFAAIRSLSVSGRPVDPVTLDAQGVLTLTGGAGYLALLSVARLP